MGSELTDRHIRLPNREIDDHVGVGFTMIQPDADENGISENEASKQARASRKLLLTAVLLVIVAVLLATVAIAVGLALTGDVRRAIGEKPGVSPSFTLSPSSSSYIPVSISSTIPHASSKHSIPETISPSNVINSISNTHLTNFVSASLTISPTEVSSFDQSLPSTQTSLYSGVYISTTKLSPLFTSVASSPTTTTSTTIQPLPECRKREFRCNSGQCVNGSAVCNQVIDCLDQSDEMFCQDCRGNGGFQCASGLCVWGSSPKCNGVLDCNDLSDELNCPKRSNSFQCSNGVQVPSKCHCDGVDDCDDNSDEANCRCINGRFPCMDGHCIMREWICDGYPDCVNGTDELNCNSCSETQFMCRDYRCLNQSRVCDGVFDCYSREDEGHCVHLQRAEANNMTALSVQIRASLYPVCSDEWTDEHSHYVCQHLNKGFQFTKFLDVPKMPQPVFLSLNSEVKLSHERPFNTLFQIRSTCPSAKTVALSCAKQDCGSRKASLIVPFVAGGNIVTKGKWPWVVSLSYLGQARCAGALIDPQWIITAGHCVVRPGELNLTTTPWMIEVMTGSVNRMANVSTTVQRIRATNLVPHPRLSGIVSSVLDWDAALVKLEKPVRFTSHTQPICLPYSGQRVSLAASCYLAGWGLVNSRTNLYPRVLREAKMLMWDSDRCAKDTVSTEKRVNINSTLCAGYMWGLPTGCQGDSGGPLMCRDTPGGPWFLAGIMSSGSPRCGNSVSGAIKANRFARIEGMVSWIQHILYGTS